MKLIYKGKTKDVYRLNNGNIELKFKDDMTGEDGVFDPGANTVGLTVEGMGRSGLRMSTYFFEKFNEAKIPTHYIRSDLDALTMEVKDVEMFGKGLEVICRFKAVGSFYRRYGAYCEEGEPLNSFIEVTIKDDERGDPPISADALEMLGIISKDDYDVLEGLTKQIANVIKDDLASKQLDLYDLKLEFGRDKQTNEIILIDEVSGGNMRVYDGTNYVEPFALEKKLF